jgi:hypothetical protein
MNDMSLPASSAFVGRVLLVSDEVITIQQLSESMQRFASSENGGRYACPPLPNR